LERGLKSKEREKKNSNDTLLILKNDSQKCRCKIHIKKCVEVRAFLSLEIHDMIATILPPNPIPFQHRIFSRKKFFSLVSLGTGRWAMLPWLGTHLSHNRHQLLYRSSCVEVLVFDPFCTENSFIVYLQSFTVATHR